MSKSEARDRDDTMREAAKLVTADRVRVSRDAFHVMHLRLDDDDHSDVRAVRAFPLSDKAPYVSFINDKDKEIALLANPDELDDKSRKLIEDALELNYFVPQITRVFNVSETWGVSHWEVDTDRGRASFEVIDREKIRHLANGGIIIVDADENRFMVGDMSRLDPRSQNFIMSET